MVSAAASNQAIMVRTVVGDETQLNSMETQLSESGIPAQVGLAIGKLGGPRSNRDSVFALIPTPKNDGVDPASLTSENLETKSARADKRKTSKGKPMTDSSSLVIDIDWVGEHAHQVSKMLVGGLHVIGIYVWCGESTFKNSTLVLWQAVKTIARAVPVYEKGEADERIVVHISYSPRRWSCRSCSLDGNFTSMSFRPCDLKMSKLLSTLQTFTSIYNFDIRLPLFQDDIQKANDMKKILLKAISLLSEQLKSAKALLDGSLITEDKGSVAEGSHEIDLLLPFADVISMQAGSCEEVVGLVTFSGTIFAQAHTFPREPLLQTVEDLKRDVIASLKSRFDILYDEAEQASISLIPEESSESEENSLLKPRHPLVSCNWSETCSFVLPRRVLVPWLDGIFSCDYLQPTEVFQDVYERCKELLSMEIPPDQSTILEPEAPGATSIGASFWGMVAGNSASSSLKPGQENCREPGKDAVRHLPKLRMALRSLYGAIAMSVMIIAMLMSLIMMFIDRRTERQ